MPEFGLGAYLVEHGVVSRERLGEALQAQVVCGGRLGTNLVELGVLDLDQLAAHLAAMTGFPLPPKDWLEAPDPRALAALPLVLAERHCVLPLQLDDGLHAALLDPGDERLRGELARAVGRPILPYVLPELRLRYGLERHLGIPRPLRFANAARKLERVRQRAAGAPEPDEPEEVRLRAEIGIRPLAAGEDLIDESSFAELHQRLVAARERAHGGPAGGEDGELLLDEVFDVSSPHAASALEAELARAPDRAATACAALALARMHVRAAALFVLHRGMLMGLAAAGEDLARHVDSVLVPIDADSLFARAAASGEAFRGAPPGTGLDARVLRALGRSQACEIAVLPIAIRGRVANLLYVDHGTEPLAETAIGALTVLTSLVADAYERLILARKRSVA
jgi:hypothetical protein